MGIINSVSMLAIILAGAAIIRERESGTMDHLLVMPLTAFEIAMSKIWANRLVIVLAVALSLTFVVRMLLGVPIAGSIPLFLGGVAIYLFFAYSHFGRVEDGRGGLGPMASAPFPIPAHRTGRAELPHPALRLASPQGPQRGRPGQAF
jgi:hypothetical protein